MLVVTSLGQAAIIASGTRRTTILVTFLKALTEAVRHVGRFQTLRAVWLEACALAIVVLGDPTVYHLVFIVEGYHVSSPEPMGTEEGVIHADWPEEKVAKVDGDGSATMCRPL